MNSTTSILSDILPQTRENQANQRSPYQVEHLYREHSASLRTFLMSRARDAETVEVILQDLYIRLMEIPDLSVIHTPSAYLSRLANNLLIDHRRRQSRDHRRLLDEPFEHLDIAEESPSPLDHTHFAQQFAVYEKILSELPREAATVLRLHRVEGLTRSEIAKKIGKSKSWVEKNIARTLLYCRNALQKAGY
jgi:RNA polymerase sigma factor (sigma-70 family)